MASFHLRWQRDIHQTVDSRTLVFSPVLLVQERKTHLTRLDPDSGTAIWEARVVTPWGWLRASGSRVFYLNQHRLMQCFNLETGLSLWDRDLGGIQGNVVPVDDLLLVGGWRDYTPVQCLDAGSGERLWVVPVRGAFSEPIAGSWGLAIPRITPDPADLVIVDSRTGRTLDRIPLPAGVQASDAGATVLPYADRLLVTTGQGAIYLMNPLDRQPLILLTRHDGGIASIGHAILGTLLVFQDGDGALCAYDLATGRMRWSAHVEPYLDWRIWEVRAAGLEDGRILVGTSEGRLLLFDAQGHEISRKTVARRILTGLGRLGASRVAFGTTGALVAYDLG
jgi:outer membrane protein assembly factor BamB